MGFFALLLHVGYFHKKVKGISLDAPCLATAEPAEPTDVLFWGDMELWLVCS